MKTELSKIISELEKGIITDNEAKTLLLCLLGVSDRNFTPTCTEVENMAVEIDKFINQHTLAKPMTYSKKLRQYLSYKLNECSRS